MYEGSVKVEVKNNILGFVISCQLTRGVALDKYIVYKTYLEVKLLLSSPTRVTIMNKISILF